jgi:hypothetical protein
MPDPAEQILQKNKAGPLSASRPWVEVQGAIAAAEARLGEIAVQCMI